MRSKRISKALLSMSALAAIASVPSQASALAIGDISVLGFNSNAPDSFAFVPWVNLAGGTTIKFTDNGFLSSAASTATDNGRGGENFATWTAPAGGLTAGTIVTLTDNNTTPTTGGTPNLGTMTGNLSGISSSGDQIFAYDGGTGNAYGTNANPSTFTGNPLFILNTASAFLTTGTVSSNTSYLPSDLNVTNGNIAFTTNTTRGQFTGSRNTLSTFAAYRTAVNTASNWTTTTVAGNITLNTTAFTLASSSSFVTLTNAGTPTLGTLSIVGGSGNYTLQNVATSAAKSGVLGISGDLAASTDAIWVYLDLATASQNTLLTPSALGSPSNLVISDVTVTIGGITYDKLLQFNNTATTPDFFAFDFNSLNSGFGVAVNNIAVVPEPTTLVGLVGLSGMALLRRRAKRA